MALASHVQSFYKIDNPQPDQKRRTLDDILALDDTTLHSVLDECLKSLFPLDEATSPLPKNEYWCLVKSDFIRFNHTLGLEWGLHYNLRRAFVRILRFYGFVLKRVESKASLFDQIPQYGDDKQVIIPTVLSLRRAANYRERFEIWTRPNGKPHRDKFPRIIRCLRLLACERQAQAFMEALEEVYYSTEYRTGIDRDELVNWQASARRPLWNIFDEEQDVWDESLEFFVQRDRERAPKLDKGPPSDSEDESDESEEDEDTEDTEDTEESEHSEYID